MDRLMPDYVEALERELVFARERYPFQQLVTVYVGGGTPSLLPPELAGRLLRFIRTTFNVAPDAEVTLEANPASTDEARIAAWLEGGVNRLSLGVQGFDPRALAVLERRTDAAQATRAFNLARQMGVANISIDLIYAVPYQSRETWLETLRRAIALEPDHVSTYCLSFEEGTLLFRRRAEGRVPEVETDLQWDQLDAACEELEAAGYDRYEVSNWARSGGFESRHNQAYWRSRPVYGAGAGAHSYATDGGQAWRWWNVARPREYVAAARSPRADGEELESRKATAESDRKSTRLNSSHANISYAVFCLKKKKTRENPRQRRQRVHKNDDEQHQNVRAADRRNQTLWPRQGPERLREQKPDRREAGQHAT